MISKSTRLRIALLAVVILTAGCTGNQAARDVAANTSKALSSYEKGIAAKIAAEKAFYAQEQAKLVEILLGTVCPDSDAAIAAGDKKKKCAPRKVTDTLLYGRIVNTANREARLAAESMVLDARPKHMAMTIKFVLEGVAEDFTFHRTISQRRADLRANLLKELAKLDSQKKKLEAVRKKLDKLAKPSDALSDFKVLQAFAGELKKIVENAKPGS